LNPSLTCITNPQGECSINVGGGNYVIKAEEKKKWAHLSNTTSLILEENADVTYYLVLQKDIFLVVKIATW